jgi:hypothetical protein
MDLHPYDTVCHDTTRHDREIFWPHFVSSFLGCFFKFQVYFGNFRCHFLKVEVHVFSNFKSDFSTYRFVFQVSSLIVHIIVFFQISNMFFKFDFFNFWV